MAGRFGKVGGVIEKVNKRHGKAAAVIQTIKKRFGKTGGIWQPSYILGVTPTGAATCWVAGGHYSDTYHFTPTVTYNNGLHISVPWSFDGGVSGDPAEALFNIGIPIAFNQDIPFTYMQPIWGVNTAFSGHQTYGFVSEIDLHLNKSNIAVQQDVSPILSDASLVFSPVERVAQQTITLSSTYLVIQAYLGNGNSSSHSDTFTLDIPNEAIYILAQGAKLPFIF